MIELPPLPDLGVALRGFLRQVSPGQVTTFRALAQALGDPAATRFVAEWIIDHPHTSRCTCHRVIRADRFLGTAFQRDMARKAHLLTLEGFRISADFRVLVAHPIREFQGEAPLLTLATWQTQVANQVSTTDMISQSSRLIAAIDVAYPSIGMGQAAAVITSWHSMENTWSCVVRQPVRFPYIPGYLAFRELPLMLLAVSQVLRRGYIPDLWVVDGSGILHPRRAGLASLLGVVAGVPTVGITKSCLCGLWQLPAFPGASAPVVLDGQRLGSVLLPLSGSRRPLFVSPGHQISVERATRLVQALLQPRQRLPSPLHWADQLSRSPTVSSSTPQSAT